MSEWFLDSAPMIALLFFLFAFGWIVFRTYRPAVKQELQSHAYIPLNEDSYGR